MYILTISVVCDSRELVFAVSTQSHANTACILSPSVYYVCLCFPACVCVLSCVCAPFSFLCVFLCVLCLLLFCGVQQTPPQQPGAERRFWGPHPAHTAPAHTHARMRTLTHMRTPAHTHTHMRTPARTHTHTRTPAHTHTHMRTPAHTRISIHHALSLLCTRTPQYRAPWHIIACNSTRPCILSRATAQQQHTTYQAPTLRAPSALFGAYGSGGLTFAKRRHCPLYCLAAQ
jgi:hypothetical protein